MNGTHDIFFGFQKKNISKSRIYSEKPEQNHWAWHFLLLIAAMFVLLSQSINQEFVKHWIIAVVHSSSIKQKYFDLAKLGLLGLAAGCIVLWFLRKIISDDWHGTVARWRKIPPRVDASAIIPEVNFSCFKKNLWLLLSIWIVGVGISLIPGYEAWADRLTIERGVFETLTVVCYLFSGLVALKLVLPLFRRNAPGGLFRWWLLGLASGCLFIALEEINWGELYFHNMSGDFIRQCNAQNDVSLHNIALPFIGTYWANGLSHFIAICGGVLLPIIIWISKSFRRGMLAGQVPLPPWISQAYFFVAAIIPQDNVLQLQRSNIPSELREITIAMGVAIWLWYMMQNRRKVSKGLEIQFSLVNEVKPPNGRPLRHDII